ncbi:MAG: hypothetical protein R3B90_07105 [Planctomycetaceae bacterium]
MPLLSPIRSVVFLLIALGGPGCLTTSLSAADVDRAALQAAIDAQADAAWQAARRNLDVGRTWVSGAAVRTLLADRLEQAGFRVQRGAPAFRRRSSPNSVRRLLFSVSSASTTLSPVSPQAAAPAREPVEGNGYGHGCGHHLFGVASSTAAIALADRIKAGELRGTVRFYGCPAEEGGSAKAFMVRDGLFNDVDAVLHWHPGASNTAGDRSTLARIAVKFRFHGRSAHAAGAPEQGRSALDAVELTNHASELMREHPGR